MIHIYVKAHLLWRVKLVAMKNAAKTFDMEMLFRALADRTRLRLLNLMGNDEVCVCYFVEVLRTPQPKISRHLAYLRRAGVVGARRDGKWMHYRLIEPADSQAAQLLQNVRNWLSTNTAMQRDRSRLIKVCCAKPPAHLANAPKPLFAEAQGSCNSF
jgi:ArsR family transcriptional regulator